MKKALVSGGAGFIGSHLCTRLINEGNRVIWAQFENLGELVKNTIFVA